MNLTQRSKTDGLKVAAKLAIERHDHVTGDQVTQLPAGTPSAHQLAQLRDHRAILGIRFARRGYLYPSFQFDRRAGRVNPHVATANRRLVRHMGVEATIVWWFHQPAKAWSSPASLVHLGRSERALRLAVEAEMQPQHR